MESQPQNPEFRKIPENFHPYSMEILTLCLLGNLKKNCRLLNFLKSTFWKNSFRSTIIVSYSFDPDQA